MEFHVSRAVRNKTGVDDLLFNYAGNAVFGNIAASREFAKRYNEAEAASEEQGTVLHAAALFAMGLIDELNHAMVASYRETLDEEVLPEALRWFEARIDAGLGTEASRAQIDKLLLAFTDQFPTVDVYRGGRTASEWLAATTPTAPAEKLKSVPNRELALEELMMLWLANINPAFKPFRSLFDDSELGSKTVYKQVTAKLPDFFATRPAVHPEIGSLLDALLAPMLASPDSLSGQLAFIRDNWAEQLGPEFRATLDRTVLAVGTLKEEDIAIWTMFHPPSAAQHRHDEPKWGTQGFVGDEFVGFENEYDDYIVGADGVRRRRELPPVLNEYEAFSPDQAWMPTVVMIAKSTYVWLEQLSKKYQRHIERLDQIPSEELGLLAERGINALWLIGLWERSTASQTIKRMMGQHDAVASAYSLKDYRIAGDLGGTWAYERLRDTARHHGIRLASDMVPNHMGIDSTWVMEHPEWFLSSQQSPFPVYSFEGPDLSTEARFEIKIEDHYFDQSDAAVVFRLRERSNGHTEFVYHGNDGTTFAWNDTAQLDYSKSVVREQVMQTILAVARLFPIIRFDAAMTLAKKHVQRLWFPLPGVGGSIPSRAESAISQAEFDAMMPNEFWREVVDRVAVGVPGTLLLAEAFWLLEGYFVRTLGMHRVYNSAFMNMLRDEENAKYRSYLKKTIEFDPDILKRYVNFMSNPDEKTAIGQFGTGDKYFGTCTMLATIPGLPMIGHGQIEAFTEKYGMEYKKARFDEWPNEDLIARHQREIAPLLKNRQLFAESHNFVMYDFWAGEGDVDENVFVYSNRVDHGGSAHGGSGSERALVLYNNAYTSTRGTIHLSCASMDKGSGELRQRTLMDALCLPSDDGLYMGWKDSASQLEYLRRSSDFDHTGFTIELRGYQYTVLGQWRELRSTEEQPWDQLAGALNGSGVYSLDEALSELRLRPLHESLRYALAPDVLLQFVELGSALAGQQTLPAIEAPEEESTMLEVSEEEPQVLEAAPASDPAISRNGAKPAEAKPEPSASQPSRLNPHLAPFLERSKWFVDHVNTMEGSAAVASPADIFAACIHNAAEIPALEARFAMLWPATAKSMIPAAGSTDLKPWAAILAYLLISHAAPESTNATAIFDKLHLRSVLADHFHSLGAEGQDIWRRAARVRVLLAHPAVATPVALADEALWSDPDVRWLAALSESDGVTYINKECFEELLWWLAVPQFLTGTSAVKQVQSMIQSAVASAVEAKYDLAKLRALLSSDPPTVKESSVEDPILEPELPTATKALAEDEPDLLSADR